MTEFRARSIFLRMEEPKFSIVLIARNETKTLPRLVQSLHEFQNRGGEIVLVDTGSKDGTPEVARGLGVKVFEKGESFRVTLDKLTADAINKTFVVEGEKPLVAAGQSFFDFASARNLAASLAKNDMVAMPDCDEIYTKFDIDRLDSIIANGASHLEYDFVFSHDADGRPDVQFTHCKFYHRHKLEWVGCVHEILRGQPGQEPACKRLDADIIKLEHWQNPEQQRGQYLTGLAWDCFMNPNKDRNSHYLARELIWSGRYRSSILEFRRHIAMNGWSPERAQSAVFIGDAHAFYGEDKEAVLAYQEAINIDSTRREPFMKLAGHYFRKNDAQRVAIYTTAGMTIRHHGYYMDRACYYQEDPHKLLYWAMYYLGAKEAGLQHWREALKFAPTDRRILVDAQFFLNLPKVSIVIPTLNRPEKLERLQQLIGQHANYPFYDVVVMQDNQINPRGVVSMVNEGVERATGELVMFLSDDAEPQQDFLIQAVLKHLENPDHLIALNDGLWNGALATHFLSARKLRDSLPEGKFFHPGFKHHGVDNFLTAWAQKNGRYSYAKLSKINHVHADDACSKLAYSSDVSDKALLAELLEQHGLTDPV